eukprot:12036785-Heterocapsa_arctica.AAC.1
MKEAVKQNRLALQDGSEDPQYFVEEAVCNTVWRFSMLPTIRATSWRRPSAIRSRASACFRGP